MKPKHIFSLLIVLLSALGFAACGGVVTEGMGKPYLSLDTMFFSDNYNLMTVEASVVGNPSTEGINSLSELHLHVYETSIANDTFPAATRPVLVSMTNLAAEQTKEYDCEVQVLVDLTMEPEMVARARHDVSVLKRLYYAERIYVSFIEGDDNVTSSTPFYPEMLEEDFVSQYSVNDRKYLYRDILSKLKEMNSKSTPMQGTNKIMLVISDGKVWGDDEPMDPQHFEMQEALLDYAAACEKQIPVFYVGMSTDEDLAPATNTTMQLVCERTGGLCMDSFSAVALYREICQLYGMRNVDFRFLFDIPDGRVFWGEKMMLHIDAFHKDSIVAEGNFRYSLGSPYEQIVVNGYNGNVFLLRGILLGLLIILDCYLILQFLVPYVRYLLFRRRYVAHYTGQNMSIAGRQVADTCYFCKAPFQSGDLVVGKCEHSMHLDCWEENGYQCPEHGVHCPDGAHFYDRHNLLNLRNAPFQMRWVLAAMFGTVIAWALLYGTVHLIAGALLQRTAALFLTSDELEYCLQFVYRMPLLGFFLAIGLTLGVQLLIRRHLPLKKQLFEIGGRTLLAGVLGYFIFLIDTVTCTAFSITLGNEFIGMISFALFSIWVVFVNTYRTPIKVKKRLLVTAYILVIVSGILGTVVYYTKLFDYRLSMLFSMIGFSSLLAMCMAYDIRKSERYFLRVEGSIKTLEIAIFKWLKVSPAATVTIGRSVDCNLQITWDIQGDVAPVQAEIRQYYGMFCLFAYEKGVFLEDGTPLKEGTPLKLYHGTSFRIGTTLFTYIEKDS